MYFSVVSRPLRRPGDCAIVGRLDSRKQSRMTVHGKPADCCLRGIYPIDPVLSSPLTVTKCCGSLQKKSSLKLAVPMEGEMRSERM